MKDNSKFGSSQSLIDSVNEVLEGTADKLGDSIDNAKSTEHAKSIIAKAPTKHLQYLHHWNMGLSGARTHKDMPHIKAELTSRKAMLSNAESSKRFADAVNEVLKGGQKKLDENNNGKLDGEDFKKLRGENEVDEVAASKTQQRAAGAALATQRGEYDGGKKGGAINRMSAMKASDLMKIAGTKTKELPMRKEDAVMKAIKSMKAMKAKESTSY